MILNMTKSKFTKITILSFILGLCFALSGCSSSQYSGKHCSYNYGTGPNNTRPYPQNKKVNLNNVSGAKIRYETRKSNGTNKDYTVLGQNYQVWRDYNSYIEEGTASWYGPGFHGKKTSLGETYNQKGFSAAHKNLALPCYVLVTNLENGRKIIVRVNDRGPFHGRRIIDLSEGAAKALKMTGKGTAKVRVEYIDVKAGNIIANAQGYSTPTETVKNESLGVNYEDKENPSKGGDFIQLVSNQDYNKALELMHQVKKQSSYPVIVMQDGKVNRVLVGPLTAEELPKALDSFRNMGFEDCFTKKF